MRQKRTNKPGAGRPSKFTYEVCYNLAKTCANRNEMRKKEASAYTRALKEGWIEDYTWFKDINTKWTRELCFEKAKEFRNLWLFQKNAYGAFAAARRSGWLKDYTWFPESGKVRQTKYAISAYDQVGNLLHRFPNINTAVRTLGVSAYKIKKSAEEGCAGGNYFWKMSNLDIKE